MQRITLVPVLATLDTSIHIEVTIDNSAFHGMELIKLQLIITKVSITR